jgi:ParB family chromosome partitioning protein
MGPLTPTLERIPIEELYPNRSQPRGKITDEELASIAQSIKKNGILQPIVARRAEKGYEIIAGERRWLAAKSIGLSHVPVIVRAANDQQMLELALVENVQREDLNPIDRGRAYDQLCQSFGLKPDEVAERLGEDRTTVINYMRILELPPAVRDWIAGGKVSMGHARSLVGIEDESFQVQLAKEIIERQMSVRAVEERVRAAKKASETSGNGKAKQEKQSSAHVRYMERRFEEVLKTRVAIREGKKKGSGRIIIEFFSLDDFQRIADTLGVRREER